MSLGKFSGLVFVPRSDRDDVCPRMTPCGKNESHRRNVCRSKYTEPQRIRLFVYLWRVGDLMRSMVHYELAWSYPSTYHITSIQETVHVWCIDQSSGEIRNNGMTKWLRRLFITQFAALNSPLLLVLAIRNDIFRMC